MCRNPLLPKLLNHLHDFVPAPLVVPGGGPFAAQVRDAQKLWSFTDQVAHQMALLGMRQYGRLIASLAQLPTVEDFMAWDRQLRVWLPADDFLSPQLPSDWRVTSDSIAARIGRRLNAECLVLVKSVSLSQAPVSDLVDDYFPQAVGSLPYRVVSVAEWLAAPNPECICDSP